MIATTLISTEKICEVIKGLYLDFLARYYTMFRRSNNEQLKIPQRNLRFTNNGIVVLKTCAKMLRNVQVVLLCDNPFDIGKKVTSDQLVAAIIIVFEGLTLQCGEL